jgi:hypothetical protein
MGSAVRLDPVRSNHHQISAVGVVTDQTRTAVALLLADGDVDLGDERAVIRFLKDAGNADGEIICSLRRRYRTRPRTSCRR